MRTVAPRPYHAKSNEKTAPARHSGFSKRGIQADALLYPFDTGIQTIKLEDKLMFIVKVEQSLHMLPHRAGEQGLTTDFLGVMNRCHRRKVDHAPPLKPTP